MDDISRELEKELKAHSRPVQVKTKINAALYFIDDYGKITPASWIKSLMALMALLMFVSTITAVIFVYLYTNTGGKEELILRLQSQDDRIQKLLSDRDILMARLVLSGNNPKIAEKVLPGKKTVEKDENNSRENSVDSKSSSMEEKVDPVKTETANLSEKASSLSLSPEDVSQNVTPVAEKMKPLPKIIGIETLKVKNGGGGELLVRFDIRNISVDLNTITGYVFVILKPDARPATEWLAVPMVSIDDGKPSNYRKGQYFSIVHFKPVNFRVKTRLTQDLFKMATVVVYDDEGGLIYMHDIMLAKSKG